MLVKDNKTAESKSGVLSIESSPEGLSVPQIILDYGNIKKKLLDIPFIGGSMIRCITERKKSDKLIGKQPKTGKKQISKHDFDVLIDYAKSIGVADIGFVEVTPHDVFKGRMTLYKYALVLIMEMNHEVMETAPSVKSSKEVFNAYKNLGIAVNKVAEKMISLGYNAQSNPALGGDVNYVKLAEKAGLGAIGKHGLLINKRLGPSLRLAVVFTDIENLPISSSDEYLWIRDFCKKCGKCARKCPASAIYFGFDDAVYEAGKSMIDYKKCAVPFSNDHGCSICLKECTFFNGDYEKIKGRFNR